MAKKFLFLPRSGYSIEPEFWALISPNGEFFFGSHQRMGIEETEFWVWAIQMRPKTGDVPDGTDPFELWAIQNRCNSGFGLAELEFFQTMCSVAQGPPICDPGPSGSSPSGAEDFILGLIL